MYATLTRACRALAGSVASCPGSDAEVRSMRTVGNRFIKPSIFPALMAVVEPLEERAMMSTYYVSSSGNDSNTGLSTASPWKSIGKVNSIDLNPGDSVLFQGGQTFYGSLSIGAGDAGSSSSPLTIGSYSGQATINSGTSNGATVLNAGGVIFSNLQFAGTPGASPQSGITFQGYTAGVYYTGDQVKNCTITGYCLAGILIESSHLNSGFSGIQITGNSIHDNVDSGIQTAGVSDVSNLGMYIAYNQVYNNYGDGVSVCTGSGIELGDVSNALVEYNSAYLNGYKGGNGGVGIWAYSSNNVTFQYNESYDNRNTRGMDGDGFDFDLDVSNSVMQYNYAFGNDGTGAQLDQWKTDNGFYNDVVRYNIFQDNGRADSYGNLEVWGKVLNSFLYNNVIYTTPASSGTNSGIRVHNSTIPGLYVNGVHFVNNIIDTTGGATLVNIPLSEAEGAQNLTFNGNLYWTNGATPTFIDGKNTLRSLASWQSIGQEIWNGAKTGIFANPLFINSAVNQPSPQVTSASVVRAAAAGFKLAATSPALSESLSLTTLYGVPSGGADYFGDPVATAAATIAGADQSPVAETAPVTTNPVKPPASAPSLNGYNVGAVGVGGSNSYAQGSYKVTAGIGNILSTSDAFRFDETTLVGNGTIIAEVSDLGSDAFVRAKAGIMIRSSLAANAAEVSLLVAPDEISKFEYRTAPGAYSGITEDTSPDRWVKLVRNGATFTGYLSADGITWSFVGSTSIAMGQSVLVGLAVATHQTQGTETATFSSVSISQG